MANRINEQCRSLLQGLGAQLILADGDEALYNSSRTTYFSAQENELRPSCIVRPQSTDEVVKVVTRLAAANCEGNQTLNFAIRSGGHAPPRGSANIDNGVTVDLSSLNSVTLSQDLTQVSVGPGAVWGDVYRKLEEHDLSVVGGRVSNVGVAGLTLGGGISFFSPRGGFACDNVVNFQVVLASGKLVNANQHENQELWKALRGGSNNFGVVTRFDFETFAHTEQWGGNVNYDISTVHDHLIALDMFAQADTFDKYSSIILNIAHVDYNGGMRIVNAALEYTQPVENPPAFQPFTKLEPQLSNSMRIGRLSNFTDEHASLTVSGSRQLFQTTTFKHSLAMLQRAYEIWDTSVSGVEKISGITWSLGFQPIPPITTSWSASRGGNSLGLDPNDGTLFVCLLSATWTNSTDDSTVYTAADRLFEDLDEAASERGVAHPFRYLNYASGSQRPIAGYGTDMQRSLQEVSRKYDPAQVFQRVVPGGFKLFG